MLDSYAGEYQAKIKAENAHKEEMDALRTINRNLSQHVYVFIIDSLKAPISTEIALFPFSKSLEASLAQINSEHCALVVRHFTSHFI